MFNFNSSLWKKEVYSYNVNDLEINRLMETSQNRTKRYHTLFIIKKYLLEEDIYVSVCRIIETHVPHAHAKCNEMTHH